MKDQAVIVSFLHIVEKVADGDGRLLLVECESDGPQGSFEGYDGIFCFAHVVLLVELVGIRHVPGNRSGTRRGGVYCKLNPDALGCN
jgi:hypothetical protein